MAITFGGLVTGLDSESIITQLQAIEKQPATLLQAEQSNAKSRSSLMSQLATRLSALQTAATGMDSASELHSVSATSSNTSVVQVTASSAAQPARHAITVSQLASAQTSRSTTFATNTAGVAGSGTLTIGVGSKSFDVSVQATDTLDDIASRINDSGATVSASVLYDGAQYRLIVQGDDTGTANALTFSESGTTLGFSTATAAKDAKFNLDGTDVTRSSNLVTDAMPGITLTLTGVSASDGTPTGLTSTGLVVSSDSSGVRKKLQSFVDAYNQVATFVSGQLSYTGTTKGQETLFGESSVQSLQRKMQQLVGGQYGPDSATLKDFGISVGRDGQLTLDATKFDVAAADTSKLDRMVFGGSSLGATDNSLAKSFDNMVKLYTSSTDGIFTIAQKNITDQVKKWDDQITRINSSADALATRLRLQFSKLEQIESGLQSQLTYLAKLGSG